MPVTTSLANAWLNTLRNVSAVYSAVYLSLHTADPGETGANEVSGGSYTRQQIPLANAASNKTLSSSADVTFNNMPAVTVTHVGVWTGTGSGATLLWTGALTQSRTLQSGDALVFPAGNIQFQIT